MDQRDFGVGGQILRALGLSRLNLITNHAKALPGLEAFGLEVVATTPLEGAGEHAPRGTKSAPAPG